MAYIAYDDLFLEHDTGPGHPESSRRLDAIVTHLKDRGLWTRTSRVELRPADREDLDLVHAGHHLDMLEARAGERGNLDPDTRVSPRTHDAALLATGALLAAADEAVGGGENRGISLVRPPGHHATRDRAMGFCLLNHIAVCARHLRVRHGLSRVAIVDFDVHHGNGTEDIFADDPSVFYLSLHRYPFYPGTGGPGGGPHAPVSNLNVPLAANTSRDVYHEAFDRALTRVEEFAPEAVLVSAGFDAHRDDPVGGLGLTAPDFARITRRLVEVAERTAQGRVISTLEGGYNLRVLGPCVEAHLVALDPRLAP